MNDEKNSLTGIELDVLKEMGNIGAGNAASALAQMVNDKIDMTIPEVRFLEFSEVIDLVGGPEAHMVCLYLTASGPAPANILLMFSYEKAFTLVNLLMNRPTTNNTTPESFTDMEYSVMLEVGNIIASTYLNSLAAFTGLSFISSIPMIGIDMAGAIMDSVLAQFGELEDRVLLLKTQLSKNEEELVGNFFLMPNTGSLDIILKSLGVNK